VERLDRFGVLDPEGVDGARGAQFGVEPALPRRDADDGARHDSSIHVDLRSVNFSIAWRLLSRPKPEPLTPPKGMVMSPSSKQLTQSTPAFRRREMRWTKLRSLLHSAAASPYSVPLAILSASSMSS